MHSRLRNLASSETREARVQAEHYNLVRTALRRLHAPMRFALPAFNSLDLHLEKDLWVVVNKKLNDTPIIAWTDFETQQRGNLHEDIPCTLRIYHRHLTALPDWTLEALALLIGEQLALPESGASVVPFAKVEK